MSHSILVGLRGEAYRVLSNGPILIESLPYPTPDLAANIDKAEAMIAFMNPKAVTQMLVDAAGSDVLELSVYHIMGRTPVALYTEVIMEFLDIWQEIPPGHRDALDAVRAILKWDFPQYW